jgi:hypothetical protein
VRTPDVQGKQHAARHRGTSREMRARALACACGRGERKGSKSAQLCWLTSKHKPLPPRPSPPMRRSPRRVPRTYPPLARRTSASADHSWTKQ